MKAKCTRLIDTFGRPQTSSVWLTLGKTYYVLSIVLGADHRWLIRIATDEPGDVGLFPIDQFIFTNTAVMTNWIARWRNRVFELLPEAWGAGDFWHRFHEHDPDAMRIFDEELQRIASSPSSRNYVDHLSAWQWRQKVFSNHSLY